MTTLISLLSKSKPKKINNNIQDSASEGRLYKELSLLDINQHKKEVLRALYNTLNNELPEPDSKLDIISYLARLSIELPLTSLDNPIDTFELIRHSETSFQSSRLKSLFTHDAGQHWYDLDLDNNYHKFFRYIYKHIFQCNPNTPKFITSRMLPYVSFPYFKSITIDYFKK
jgi:hypothetical protein